MAAVDNVYLELPPTPENPKNPENKVSTVDNIQRQLPHLPISAQKSDGYTKPHRQSFVQTMFFKSKHGDLQKKRLLCIIGVISGLFFVGLTVGLITKWTCDSNKDVNRQCLWSSWSFWTVCSSSTIFGKQYRFRQYSGPAHSCQMNETIEDQECPDDQYTFDLKFDPSTLHQSCYLSADNKVLSNHFGGETKDNPNDVNQLQNYTGSIGNICSEENTKIYFEIYFQYEILDFLYGPYLLLEVGLAERNKIDNILQIGDKKVGGWSLQIYSCPNLRKICLSVQHGKVDSLKFTLSSNEDGTVADGFLGFLVDRERSEFSFMRDGKKFFTFPEVESDELLCLVFGVFNPSSVKVSQEIITAKNYTDILKSHWT
ncbi:uncharacterized protein LOC127709300 [Mytilus californianus]|uniref:uncharacterized protein LOC127709300 n=1 Tax=Mytilus californianus TaxID=6549 RepID=UPI00224738C7|nr:uncharacterized protein LOC127709300 [Mytilus californianus]